MITTEHYNKTVYIFGDSWSVRSKNKKENFVEVYGDITLEDKFISNNINAKNFSKEAASNFEIIKIIKSTNLDRCDQLIVFQTDPLRDILDRKNIRLSTLFDTRNFNECTNIDQVSEKLLKEFYQFLSTINKQILLVGGLSKVSPQCNYSNITVFSKSWTELVDNSFEDCYYEWTEFTETVCQILNLTEDITSIKQKIYAKNNIWQNSDAFGWCHPSDIGYNLMFEQLCKYLK